MKLAAQVRRAPGDSLASRIECLAQAGFEAVEVHTDALEQLGEYQAALRSVGIPALSMCPAGPDFDLVRDLTTANGGFRNSSLYKAQGIVDA